MDNLNAEPITLNGVVAALNARKGEWQEIAGRAAVPYSTLAKVAGGFTANPRYETIARLHRVLFDRVPPDRRPEPASVGGR